jgi:Flp pilus assembly protein TadD
MKPLFSILLIATALTASGCATTEHSAVPPVQPQPPSSAAIAPQKQTALYLNVVGEMVKEQKFGAALAFLDDYATKESNPEPQYWMLRGDALLGSGRASDARLAFDKLDATPLVAEGWDGKGRIASASQQWRDADADFEKAAGLEPSNPLFLNNLAFAKMHLGENAASAFRLRQAHELNPTSGLIRNNLVVALTLAGDTAGANHVLDEIADAGERGKVRDFANDAARKHEFASGGTL